MTIKINFKNIEDKLLWLITTFSFVSLYIFYTYTWGKYVLVITSAFVFAVGVLLHGGFSYRIKLNMFHIMQIIFGLYCLFSCIWAIDLSLSLARTFTMFQILIFFSMLMAYYIKFDSIQKLLDVLMWSGYAVSIYTFFYYGGFSKIMDIINSTQRLKNDFANANSIGMLCAIACIIQFYKILYNKKYLSAIFVIPTIIILAACQSRKSVLMLIIGMVAIIVMKNANNKIWLISFVKIVISLVLLFFALKYLLSLNIFAGMNNRLEGLLSFFTSDGSIDGSTALRNQFMKIGFDYFMDSPIIGYGFGSSSAILARETSYNTYFHNNYVELLVCGGILGFFLYYFNYAYLLYHFIKLRKFAKKETDICIILLFVQLILDFGMVSFVDKAQYFYFMIFYIHVEILKRKKNNANVYQSIF